MSMWLEAAASDNQRLMELELALDLIQVAALRFRRRGKASAALPYERSELAWGSESARLEANVLICPHCFDIGRCHPEVARLDLGPRWLQNGSIKRAFGPTC